MRTSLNKIKQAEDFLSGSLKPEDSVLMRAKLLLDPVLRMNMRIQQKVYTLIALYGRRKLKDEIDEIHSRVFNDPDRAAYREKIIQLFSKS
jgi:hypothetical protein